MTNKTTTLNDLVSFAKIKEKNGFPLTTNEKAALLAESLSAKLIIKTKNGTKVL